MEFNREQRKLIRMALMFRVDSLQKDIQKVRSFIQDEDNEKWELKLEDDRLAFEDVLLEMYKYESMLKSF